MRLDRHARRTEMVQTGPNSGNPRIESLRHRNFLVQVQASVHVLPLIRQVWLDKCALLVGRKIGGQGSNPHFSVGGGRPVKIGSEKASQKDETVNFGTRSHFPVLIKTGHACLHDRFLCRELRPRIMPPSIEC